MNDARFTGEQGRGQNGQRGIFRTAHLDRTRERMAAVNKNLIHTWQTEIVSYLNNRFSNKCRGNFFPPMSKKAPCSDPGRFPGRASRPVEDAAAPVRSAHRLVRHLWRRRRGRSPDRAGPHAKEDVDLAWRCSANSR